MLPLALQHWPRVFRERHVVWQVDNSSTMASFIKGASGDMRLERIVAVYWILAFHLQASVWIEWVQSKSNWSDELSRRLGEDTSAEAMGYEVSKLPRDCDWWYWDLSDVWDEAYRRTRGQAAHRTPAEQ